MKSASEFSAARELPLWQRDPALWFWALLAVGATTLFRLTDLDVRISGCFHSAASGWVGDHFAEPWATLADGAHQAILGAWIASAVWMLWRGPTQLGAYMLLLSVVAAGILINLILKDYSGRPRPEQIEAFGGHRVFQRVLEFGPVGRGKSFPSGHAGIGFLAIGLWHVLRLARPMLARLWLVLGIGSGALVGLLRISSGAHFASDVLWSALLVWIVGWLIVRLAPKLVLGATGQQPTARRRWAAPAAGSLLAAAAIAFALVAKLHYTEIRFATPVATVRALELSGDDLQVVVRLDPGASELTMSGELRGFGFPSARLEHRIEFLDGQVRARFWTEGVFTEQGGAIEIVAPSRLERLDIRLERGSIRVEAPPDVSSPATCNVALVKGPASDITLPSGWAAAR